MIRYTYDKTEGRLIAAFFESKTFDDVEAVIKLKKPDSVIDIFIEMYLNGTYPFAEIESEYVANEERLADLIYKIVITPAVTEVNELDERIIITPEIIARVKKSEQELTDEDKLERHTCLAIRKKLETGIVEHQETQIDSEGNEQVITVTETVTAYPWLATYRGLEGAPIPPVFNPSLADWKISNYSLLRKHAYKSAIEQLKMIYEAAKSGENPANWVSHIDEVRAKYPDA